MDDDNMVMIMTKIRYIRLHSRRIFDTFSGYLARLFSGKIGRNRIHYGLDSVLELFTSLWLTVLCSFSSRSFILFFYNFHESNRLFFLSMYPPYQKPKFYNRDLCWHAVIVLNYYAKNKTRLLQILFLLLLIG